MKIEDIKELAGYTNSKTIVKLLMDEHDYFIRNVLNIIKLIINEKIEFKTNDLISLISLLKKEKGAFSFEESYDIIDACKSKSLKEIILLLKFYKQEKYNDNAYKYIINMGNVINVENLKRIYNACKDTEFIVDIYDYWNFNTNKTLFNLRSVDEIIKMIQNAETLYLNNLCDIMLNEKVIKYRTFEESVRLKNYIIAVAKKFDSSDEKHEIDRNHYMLGIHYLIINANILKKMSYHEQMKLINILCSVSEDEFDRINDLITEMSTISMSFSGQMQILDFYFKNRTLFTYKNLMNNIKNAYEIGISNLLKSLEEISEPVTVKEQLSNSKTLQDFINTLEENNIKDFNQNSKVYRLYNPEIKKQ